MRARNVDVYGLQVGVVNRPLTVLKTTGEFIRDATGGAVRGLSEFINPDTRAVLTDVHPAERARTVGSSIVGLATYGTDKIMNIVAGE